MIVYAHDVTPRVGMYVKPDRWDCGSLLKGGDDFSTFRLPTHCGGPITSVAVEIIVTGRTLQAREQALWVRVRIVFPGDGEPDTHTGGWMLVD